MGTPRGDAKETKAAILQAARQLFAAHDISSVSIRDIAQAAGVSHGLVQRYFGSREQMVEEIVRAEVIAFNAVPGGAARGATPGGLEALRQRLRDGRAHFHEYAAIIARAELGGLRPESMLDPDLPTPAAQLADMIAGFQADTADPDESLDPRMVSAFVNAALFAFATMAPWLMAAVGLTEDDYEARSDEVIDICLAVIGLAVRSGGPPGVDKGPQ